MFGSERTWTGWESMMPPSDLISHLKLSFKKDFSCFGLYKPTSLKQDVYIQRMISHIYVLL